MRVLVSSLLVIAFPFLVYVGMKNLRPRILSFLLLSLFSIRIFFSLNATGGRRIWSVLSGMAPLLIPLGWSIVFNDKKGAQLMPVFASAALLYSFGRTLWIAPTMIERFARLQVADLSDEEVRYCRKVTMVWCFFFFGNALVALWISMFGTLDEWLIYNGVLSYLLVGALLAGEHVIRWWHFPHRAPFPLRKVFSRIL